MPEGLRNLIDAVSICDSSRKDSSIPDTARRDSGKDETSYA